MTPRVVCVLSGGGAKSAAHLGALRALTEYGLSAAHYVGTSMGAVIAACFASGLTYEEVLVRVSAVRRRDVASLSPLAILGPFAPNLLKGGPLRDTIATLVPARRFDELDVPLTVTAVDLRSGELELFGAEGRTVPLVEALAASCALPVFYPSVTIGDRQYADGGLRAVLPLDVAGRLSPELLFAVNVGPQLGEPETAEPSNLPAMVRAHNVATRILMAAQLEETVKRWRESPVPMVLVEPRRDPGSTFAVQSMPAFLEDGYRVAWRELAKWSASAREHHQA